MNETADRDDDTLLEDLLAEWLRRREVGEAADVDALCVARPDLAPALRAMTALAVALPGREAVVEDPLLGRRLGDRYVLTACLGAGGMGLVYAGRDEQLGRDVAVKVLDDLFARDPGRVQRFEREARALAAVADPHIVAVHDLDLRGRPPYLVMDRVFGFDLATFVRALREDVADGRLPSAERVGAVVRRLTDTDTIDEVFARPWPLLVARLGQQMGQALHAAHAVGVVHRDVKPSNFMLDAKGRVRLLDFGLARSDLDPTLTRADTRLGTPLYMPPEVVRGTAATVAGDVYALGATLYELLCLQPPFVGQGSELETRILCDEPPSPRVHRMHVPRDLAAVCLEALAKNPVHRYESAAAFAADLARFATFEPVLARARAWPAPVRTAIGTFRRYRGAIVATVGLVVVATLVAIAAGHLLGSERARAAAADVRAQRAEAAALHAGLSPYLGFAAGRNERLSDPGRAATLAALDRILALTPDDDVARFLRLWVRGEEEPAATTVAGDRTELSARLGAERLQRLYADVACALQQRNRTDRAAGAAQMEAALIALEAEPKPWGGIARRLHITTALQLAEFDLDRRPELADVVLGAVAEIEAERHRELADLAAGDAGRTAFTWFARGAALLLHDDLRGARDAYRESHRLCAAQPATLHALARVHRLLGEPTLALACIEDALAATPTPHVNHLEQHALALLALGEFPRVDAVLARFPDDPDSRARRHILLLRARVRQAALESGDAARTRLLADADASLLALHAFAAQGRLGTRQVRAMETGAADVSALRTATPVERIALYVGLLLEGAGGSAVGDPLARHLLDRLGDALVDAGHARLGELLHAQAQALTRLEQDGVLVR